MTRNYSIWKTERKYIGEKKNEQSLRDLWNNNKSYTTCVIGVPEGERKNAELKKTFEEIMTERCKHIDSQNWMKSKSKKSMPRHIVIKHLKTKDKEKNLNSIREKWHIYYRGRAIQITADYSSETMNHGGWQEVAQHFSSNKRKE